MLLALSWSDDLKDFRVAEILHGIERYRSHGPEVRGQHIFPVPSQVRMSIKANRDAGSYPPCIKVQPALDEKPQEEEQNRMEALLAEAIQRWNMPGHMAIPWAVRRLAEMDKDVDKR